MIDFEDENQFVLMPGGLLLVRVLYLKKDPVDPDKVWIVRGLNSKTTPFELCCVPRSVLSPAAQNLIYAPERLKKYRSLW